VEAPLLGPRVLEKAERSCYSYTGLFVVRDRSVEGHSYA
jgi:hypothetical protein